MTIQFGQEETEAFDEAQRSPGESVYQHNTAHASPYWFKVLCIQTAPPLITYYYQ